MGIESSHIKNECEDAVHRLYHYLDNELTDDLRIKIKKHLDDCPPCGKAFDFESELRKVIADKCKDRVPESLRLRIAVAIQHEIKSSEPTEI